MNQILRGNEGSKKGHDSVASTPPNTEQIPRYLEKVTSRYLASPDSAGATLRYANGLSSAQRRDFLSILKGKKEVKSDDGDSVRATCF